MTRTSKHTVLHSQVFALDIQTYHTASLWSRLDWTVWLLHTSEVI